MNRLLCHAIAIKPLWLFLRCTGCSSWSRLGAFAYLVALWLLSACLTPASAVVFFSDDVNRASFDTSRGRSGIVQDQLTTGADTYSTTRVWTAAANGLEIQANGVHGFNANTGNHRIELDTTANSSMSTLISLQQGQSYRLRYFYRSVSRTVTTTTTQCTLIIFCFPVTTTTTQLVGGGLSANITSPGYASANFAVGDAGAWTEAVFTFVYTGPSGDATLTFSATGPSDSIGTQLDDIKVETTIAGNALGVEALTGILPPPVPGLLTKDTRRTDIVTPIVVDKPAAIALGKALFWDAAIGSDQMACASCHFHSGADNRTKNQMSPGLNHAAVSGRIFDLLRSGNKSGPNYTVSLADFPFDPNVDDTLTSSGTFSGDFQTSVANSNDDACGRAPSNLFHVNGIGTRAVEPRNTPTVINAAYNFRNFWDGRANNEFNGISPFGARDTSIGVFLNTGTVASAPVSTTYQQGANAYAGTVDTYLDRAASGSSFGSATSMLVDDGSPNAKNTLIRFDNFIGTGPGQIPPGSTITSATLRVFVTRTDAFDFVSLHRMLAPWSEASTWNSMGSGVSLNNVEASSTSLFRLSAGGSGAQNFTGLASTVQAWVNGAPNYGWVIATSSVDADNWTISSAQAPTASQRPALVITYTPPAATTGVNVSKRPLKLQNASLASQAVGPVTSDLEMACRGRQFADVGRKLLPRKPLALQTVAADDSVLSGLPGMIGASGTYASLVQRAFAPAYWNGNCGTSCGTPGAGVTPAAAYTQIEANFSLFFGIALQMYQETLVSDDTRFDRWKRGLITATPSEANGEAVFIAKQCIECHIGPLATSAARLQKNENLVEGMLMRGTRNAIYDVGFYNLGVVPTAHDNGGGSNDPFGNPLSFTRQFITSRFVDSFGTEPCLFEVDLGLCANNTPAQRALQNSAVTGTFKTPTLRNVTLTGPYMHNGGLATLEQVVDFYDRGGNVDNFDKHPAIVPLGLTAQEKVDLVAFMKMFTDERVLFRRAPFDHPSLPLPNGHSGNQNTVAGGNGLGAVLAQDEIRQINAVGRNGVTQPLRTFAETLGAP